MTSNGICLMFPLITDWDYGIEEQDHRDKVPFASHLINTVYHSDVDLGHMVRSSASSGFSTVELPFPTPFPHCTLWKEVRMWRQCLRSGDYAPPPWRWSICMIYLEFFCGGICFFSINYLYIHSIIIYISMGSWIFMVYFGLHSTSTIFCSNCSSFGHWELFPSTSVSLWHNLTNVVCFCLFNF